MKVVDVENLPSFSPSVGVSAKQHGLTLICMQANTWLVICILLPLRSLISSFCDRCLSFYWQKNWAFSLLLPLIRFKQHNAETKLQHSTPINPWIIISYIINDSFVFLILSEDYKLTIWVLDYEIFYNYISIYSSIKWLNPNTMSVALLFCTIRYTNIFHSTGCI